MSDVWGRRIASSRSPFDFFSYLPLPSSTNSLQQCDLPIVFATDSTLIVWHIRMFLCLVLLFNFASSLPVVQGYSASLEGGCWGWLWYDEKLRFVSGQSSIWRLSEGWVFIYPAMILSILRGPIVLLVCERRAIESLQVRRQAQELISFNRDMRWERFDVFKREVDQSPFGDHGSVIGGKPEIFPLPLLVNIRGGEPYCITFRMKQRLARLKFRLIPW